MMDQAVLDALGLAPGQVRENVTVSGVTLDALPQGARLRLGGAVVEITEPCQPCRRMEEIRNGLASELKGRRGMLARVVEGGTIALGDGVALL